MPDITLSNELHAFLTENGLTDPIKSTLRSLLGSASENDSRLTATDIKSEVVNHAFIDGSYVNNDPTVNDGFSGIHYCGSGVVIAGRRNYPDSNHAIYRSTDFGETYTPVNTSVFVSGYQNAGETGNHVYVPGSNGDTIFVGTGDQGKATLFKSTDKGLTWTVALTSSQIASLLGTTDNDLSSVFACIYLGDSEWIAACKVNLGGKFILKSTDNGENWTAPTTTGLVGSIRNLTRMSDGTLLGACPFKTPYGLYKSIDGGINWSLSGNFRAFSTVAEIGPGIWAAGDVVIGSDPTVNLYTTNDYGETWTITLSYLASGLPSLGYFRVVQRIKDGRAIAYLSCHENSRNTRLCRAFETDDYGQTWVDKGIVQGGGTGDVNSVYSTSIIEGSHIALAMQPDTMLARVSTTDLGVGTAQRKQYL